MSRYYNNSSSVAVEMISCWAGTTDDHEDDDENDEDENTRFARSIFGRKAKEKAADTEAEDDLLANSCSILLFWNLAWVRLLGIVSNLCIIS